MYASWGFKGYAKYCKLDVHPSNPPAGVILTFDVASTFATPGNTHVLTNFPSIYKSKVLPFKLTIKLTHFCNGKFLIVHSCGVPFAPPTGTSAAVDVVGTAALPVCGAGGGDPLVGYVVMLTLILFS